MKNNYNWHKRFFSGLWLELQRTMNTDELSLKQAKFLIDVLKLKSKQKVLDIPCGNGRISNILSRRGIDTTGVDFNEQLLNEAKKEAKKRSLRLKFFKMNMYDIKWEDEFDAAFCFWGSFGYFNDELNIMFLEKIYTSLRKGGKFLIDTVTADTLLPRFQKRGWVKVRDIYILEDRNYDVLNSRIDVEWTFIKKGIIETRKSSIKMYTYAELVVLLKSIGFRKFSCFGSIDKTEFSIKSNRLYLIAVK